MGSSISSIDSLNKSAEEIKNNIMRILIPTACREDTIHEIYPVLNIFSCNTEITFFHVVPLSTDSLYDCVDLRDVNYAISVAEKRLYNFVKMMPSKDNVFYDYKIKNGKSKDELLKAAREGSYDLIALHIGDISHFSHSVFDVFEIVNMSTIPVIIFGRKKEDMMNEDYRIDGGEYR